MSYAYIINMYISWYTGSTTILLYEIWLKFKTRIYIKFGSPGASSLGLSWKFNTCSTGIITTTSKSVVLDTPTSNSYLDFMEIAILWIPLLPWGSWRYSAILETNGCKEPIVAFGSSNFVLGLSMKTIKSCSLSLNADIQMAIS